MEYQRDYEFEDYLTDLIANREFADRSGIHQSDLNYCLNKQFLRKKLETKPTRDEVLLYSLGWATQRWLTGRPDEEPIIKDDIVVTLDALYEDIPWELKATYTGRDKEPIENVAYMRQLMAQCKARGTTTARLSRFEIMGDWQWVFPRGKSKDERDTNKANSTRPTLSAFLFTFTQDEIDRNWEWFISRRKLFEALLAGSPLLPRIESLPPAGKYECEKCPFNGEECK